MNERIEAIHQFWFRGVNDTEIIDKSKWPYKMWFIKDKRVDEEIRNNFEDDIRKAHASGYKEWERSPRGRLALILLFDQFSRNIYRNTPQMFAFDKKALPLTLLTINEKKDSELMLIERVFLYLPLEHSEDLKMQELSVNYCAQLVEDSNKINPKNIGYYKYTFDYAQRHYDIIKRFGRFPHRNRIFGRTSTEEERMFLEKPGSGF